MSSADAPCMHLLRCCCCAGCVLAWQLVWPSSQGVLSGPALASMRACLVTATSFAGPVQLPLGHGPGEHRGAAPEHLPSAGLRQAVAGSPQSRGCLDLPPVAMSLWEYTLVQFVSRCG